MYLRSIGVPIPGSGDRGGTLRISFTSLSSSSDAAVTVRTTTSAPGGRAGLAYEGIPIAKLLTGTAYLCGLRQTESDRSNLAIQNAGAEGAGDVVIRLTVFSGSPTASFSKVLPDERLSPGDFKQVSGILQSNGLSLASGYVRVERIVGSAPYYAYAVINDQTSSDGSFVPPVLETSLVGLNGLTLPAIVEANAFTSEVILTNWSTSSKKVNLTYMADAVQSSDKKVVISRTVQAGEQVVIPNLIQFFRESGLAEILPLGSSYAGPLMVTVDDGDVSSLSVGARISTPGAIGRYGLFYAGVPFGTSSTSSAWLYGLQQNAENRTNLALVTTSSTDENADVFSIDLYDGNSGLQVNTLEGITVKAGEWKQIGSILAQYATGTTQGYAQVRRTSGSNRFIAYAVINDGGQPGERTGDGTFIASVFPPTPPSSSLQIGSREDLLTKDTIQARGLCFWPDGVMGVLSSQNTHTFFGNSGGGCSSPDGLPSKTIGTLINPIVTSVSPRIPILNMKHGYNYSGGGPVYEDPASGTLLMFYHAEKWPGGDYRPFWSLLGMAKSSDNGASWADLGEIISPSTPFSETGTSSLDVSSGSFVIVGPYFYVCFNDLSADDGYMRAAVARAKVADVLNAAISQNDVVPWKKYYNGDWNEPGLGDGLVSSKPIDPVPRGSPFPTTIILESTLWSTRAGLLRPVTISTTRSQQMELTGPLDKESRAIQEVRPTLPLLGWERNRATLEPSFISITYIVLEATMCSPGD